MKLISSKKSLQERFLLISFTGFWGQVPSSHFLFLCQIQIDFRYSYFSASVCCQLFIFIFLWSAIYRFLQILVQHYQNVKGQNFFKVFSQTLYTPSAEHPSGYLLLYEFYCPVFPLLYFCHSSFRPPTTVSWLLWRFWGSWCSVLWPVEWWIGLVSKWPSSSSSPSQLEQPFMCGQLPSPVPSGRISSKISPNEIRLKSFHGLLEFDYKY